MWKTQLAWVTIDRSLPSTNQRSIFSAIAWRHEVTDTLAFTPRYLEWNASKLGDELVRKVDGEDDVELLRVYVFQWLQQVRDRIVIRGVVNMGKDRPDGPGLGCPNTAGLDRLQAPNNASPMLNGYKTQKMSSMLTSAFAPAAAACVASGGAFVISLFSISSCTKMPKPEKASQSAWE